MGYLQVRFILNQRPLFASFDSSIYMVIKEQADVLENLLLK